MKNQEHRKLVMNFDVSVMLLPHWVWLILWDYLHYRQTVVHVLCDLFPGGCENVPQVKVKEEKMDSFDFEAHMASALSSVTDTALPSPCSAAQCASPPSSTLPFTPVVIKQEPLSPARVSTEPDPAENTFPWAHSTTPELPVPPAASHSGNMISCALFYLKSQWKGILKLKRGDKCWSEILRGTKRKWATFDTL